MMGTDFLLHKVLREIKSGVSLFEPGKDADGDMDKFQAIAKAVVHADQQGYIQNIKSSVGSMRGQKMYEKVFIIGGLTFEGEKFLEKSSGQPTPADEALTGLLNRISGYSIREKWEKLLHRRVTDPSGAITVARSLLETTLKWIIEERGGEATDNNKELFNRAIDALGIEVKGKPIEKTIEGLRLVIWGVGDMRNKHGDAHGATSSSAVPTPSEAGLCVNLAGAAALYLLEVFESDQHE